MRKNRETGEGRKIRKMRSKKIRGKRGRHNRGKERRKNAAGGKKWKEEEKEMRRE